MSQARRMRRRQERQDSKVKNIFYYINVCDIASDMMTTLEYDFNSLMEINSQPEIKDYTVNDFMLNLIESFRNQNQPSLYVSAAVLVNQHLLNLDGELSEIVKKQKHNSFTIIIDGMMAYVWGSTPAETKEYSQQHSNFLYISYKETTPTQG
jgi:hypothetical protein